LERIKLERRGEMNDDLQLIVSDQTQQLEKFARDWATAELRGDTAFLGHNLAENFVGVGPYGFLLTKDEWLERHESWKLRYESFCWTKCGSASTERWR
jgi:hypothetical protein